MRQSMIVLLICAATIGAAQIKTASEDVFRELDSGALTLRINDAVTGKAIPGASVSLSGTGEFETDDEGSFSFPAPTEDGVLTAVITAPGYIRTEVPVEIMAGTLFFNRISVSPRMEMKHLRIVLDWGKQPGDLDAHFVKLGAEGYHLSYRNMRVLKDGSGKLDIDAMNGYGPETITVNDVSSSAVYEFSVQDFTNAGRRGSTALSDARATVKVYGEGALLKVMQVPRKKEGTVWNVFRIENGVVREVRQLGEMP